jgi:hypothetical protein
MKNFTATAIISAASACLTSMVFVGIINVAATSDVGASIAPIQTITVHTARMSAEDKLAYDLELAQMPVSQVVVIHAKRLTVEQIAAERAAEKMTTDVAPL